MEKPPNQRNTNFSNRQRISASRVKVDYAMSKLTPEEFEKKFSRRTLAIGLYGEGAGKAVLTGGAKRKLLPKR